MTVRTIDEKVLPHTAKVGDVVVAVNDKAVRYVLTATPNVTPKAVTLAVFDRKNPVRFAYDGDVPTLTVRRAMTDDEIAAQDAERHAFAMERVADYVAKRTEDPYAATRTTVEEFNEAMTKSVTASTAGERRYALHDIVQRHADVLVAREAVAEVWSDVKRLVAEGATPLEALVLVRQDVERQILTAARRNGESRSTSRMSNLTDDVRIAALAAMLDDSEFAYYTIAVAATAGVTADTALEHLKTLREAETKAPRTQLNPFTKFVN